MPFVDALAALLCELQQGGSVAANRVSQCTRRQLKELFDEGALEFTDNRSGRFIVVRNGRALARFARAQFPSGLYQAASKPLGLTRSENNTPLRQDTRKQPPVEPVLVRGFGHAVLHHTERDDPLPVADLTCISDVAAFFLSDDCEWYTNGFVALVTGTEAFRQIENRLKGIDMAFLTDGPPSPRFVRWLRSNPMRRARFLYCCDYDPSSVDVFIQLKTNCGNRLRMFIPDDLEARILTHGSSRRIQGTHRIMSRLRTVSDPDVHKVISLIDTHGMGMGQEMLFE